MAELHVERKSSTVWPWIVAGLLVFALAVWYLWPSDGTERMSTADSPDSSRAAVAPAMSQADTAPREVAGTAAAEYLRFVDSRASRANGPAHVSTADGLRKLAAAMLEVAGSDSVDGVALRPRIEAIRERADAIERSPDSREHALQVREAFVVASSLITQMSGQRGSATAGSLADLRDASTAIEASRPLLDQSEQIEEFFARAGDALRSMTTAGR